MVGVAIAQGTVLKGCSIWKVENHFPELQNQLEEFPLLGSIPRASESESLGGPDTWHLHSCTNTIAAAAAAATAGTSLCKTDLTH